MKLQTKLTNNVYLLSFVATVGGSLFGFDISSMSAWIGTTQYNDYFNSPNSDLQVHLQIHALEKNLMQ